MTGLGRAGRMARKAAVAIVAAALVPLTLLWIFQGKFIYVPFDELEPLDPSVGVVDVRYRAADGVALAGWFVPARDAAATCPASTVLAFHGQMGNRSGLGPWAAALSLRGVNVFLAEYRGYGGAEGSPSEDGFRLDALAAADVVTTLPGVDRDRLVFVGSSLGTGVAAPLAIERRAAGVVLLAPYTSLVDVAAARLPGIPYSLLMRDRFETIERIGAVPVPTIVVLGTHDGVVPPEQSRRVHAGAAHPDRLVEVPGAGHEVVDAPAGTSFDATLDAVRRFTGCNRTVS